MDELRHVEHLVFDVKEKAAELRTIEAAHDSLIRLRTTPTMSVGVDAPGPCMSTGVTSALGLERNRLMIVSCTLSSPTVRRSPVEVCSVCRARAPGCGGVCTGRSMTPICRRLSVGFGRKEALQAGASSWMRVAMLIILGRARRRRQRSCARCSESSCGRHVPCRGAHFTPIHQHS